MSQNNTKIFLGSAVQKVNPIHLLLAFLLAMVVIFNGIIRGENEFSVLSGQFLQGHLYLPGAVGDAVLHEDRYYWPLGPFPAILLVPFTLLTLLMFGVLIPQGVINIVCVLLILLLAYKISLKYNFNHQDSLWLTTAMVFSSVFFLSAVLPWSWHFSQTITFLLGLISLNSYLNKGKVCPIIIGICHALMLMTRFTAGLGILFYILAIIFSKDRIIERSRKLILLITPLFLAGLLLLWYNHVRFGNLFDNGYTTANNWVLASDSYRYEMLKYGLFNIKNIPTNIYYYFINPPSPVLERSVDFSRHIFKTDPSMIIHLVYPYIKVSTPGVSFFVVSPILLLVFRNKLRSHLSIFSFVTAIIILFLLMTYYWTGWTQLGPRYTIDLLPFIFILFLESFKVKQVLLWQKTVIFLSAFFNLYLYTNLFA